LEYSSELKEKMIKFFNTQIESRSVQIKKYDESSKFTENIKKNIDDIIDNNTLKKNINELLINIAKFYTFFTLCINYNEKTIEDNVLYKFTFLIEKFIEIIYNKNYDNKIILSRIFEDTNTAVFDNSKIKRKYTTNTTNTYNKNNHEYKIFAQYESDYLLLEKHNSNFFGVDIVFIHAPEETNTATTPAKEETEDDATKLAIAAATISANTTNKGGGKTQKRLPKRKRSIVFSRRK